MDCPHLTYYQLPWDFRPEKLRDLRKIQGLKGKTLQVHLMLSFDTWAKRVAKIKQK